MGLLASSATRFLRQVGGESAAGSRLVITLAGRSSGHTDWAGALIIRVSAARRWYCHMNRGSSFCSFHRRWSEPFGLGEVATPAVVDE
jgi:hypothetical protein